MWHLYYYRKCETLKFAKERSGLKTIKTKKAGLKSKKLV